MKNYPRGRIEELQSELLAAGTLLQLFALILVQPECNRFEAIMFSVRYTYPASLTSESFTLLVRSDRA
jgi:hypothetical protein